MSDIDGRRLRLLFEQASGLPPDELAAFLEKECAGDPQLRTELESLLSYDEDDDRLSRGIEFGASIARDLAQGQEFDDCPILEPMPERIGEFTILGRIGMGGNGIVYRAQQQHPRRQVALKVLRTQDLSEARLDELAREANVLAGMQHDGIAKIFESHPHPPVGAPYFVLELIDGLPIDRWAAMDRSLEARIRVVIQICKAVSFAHGRLVVHCDLKPSNVLVTDADVVKVLDFGIARRLGSDAERMSRGAPEDGLAGSLPYMSPERFEPGSVGITLQADVYAIGVILFVLIAGELPYDFENEPYEEIFARMRGGERPNLSRRGRRLRHDLQSIVDEAMAYDPRQRYASCDAFAEDLERFLRGDPVKAHAWTPRYLLGRFADQHRGLIASVTTVALLLVAVVAGSVLWSLDSAEAEAAARESAAVERDLRQDAEILAARVAFDAGRLAASRGRWKAALEHYEEARALGYEDDVELALRRIDVLEADFQTPRALHELAELKRREVRPQYTPRVLLAATDLGVNRWVDPEAGLDELRKMMDDPAAVAELSAADRAFAQALLADTLDAAIAALHEARDHDPLHRRTNEALALALLAAGRAEEARTFGEFMHDVYRDDPSSLTLAVFLRVVTDTPSRGPVDWEASMAGLDESQRQWVEFMTLAAELLREFDHKELDGLLEGQDASYAAESWSYLTFAGRAAGLLARSRRAASDEAAPQSGRTMFRLLPVVARSYRELFDTAVSLIPNMMGLRSDDEERIAATVELMDRLATQLGEGLFHFGGGLFRYYRADYPAALPRLARAATRPSLLISSKTADLHVIDCAARWFVTTPTERRDPARLADFYTQADTSMARILTQPDLEEREFAFLFRRAQALERSSLVRRIGLQWTAEHPDSAEANRCFESWLAMRKGR